MDSLSSDLTALIKVSSTVAASMTYARFPASSTRPGFPRLVSLLPVILLLLFLPSSFKFLTPRSFSASFLVWLANLKLLLLSFGLGPLSPSLPLPTFIATSSLPIKIRDQPINDNDVSSSKSFIFVGKALIWAIVVEGLHYSINNLQPQQLHRTILIPCQTLATFFYLYLGHDVLFGMLATLTGGLLGLHLEAQFNAPLRSTSLEDFWGRRWNLMMGSSLRAAVYDRTKPRFGETVAVMSTFLVSGLLHEMLVYYAAEAVPSGEMTLLFVIHGACVVLDKKARRGRWRWWWSGPRHPVIGGVVAFGIVGATGTWLLTGPFRTGGIGATSVEESLAIVRFFEEGGWMILNKLIGGSS